MWREEYSAGERNAQRYITFSSKAVLQGLCSDAVSKGVLEKGSSMLLGIRKTGKCWTKGHFPPEYGAETSKSLPQKVL